MLTTIILASLGLFVMLITIIIYSKLYKRKKIHYCMKRIIKNDKHST